MQDTNGNYIQIQYGPAATPNAPPNTSGRITSITDTRGFYQFTYTYLNNGADLFPHLTGVSNNINTPENYSFLYAYSSLSEPFNGTAFGMATALQRVTVSNVNISYNLLYALGTGELTQAATPTGGILAWGYRTYTYSGSGLSYREVQTRQMSPAAGVTYSWNIKLGNNDAWLHASATVEDLGTTPGTVNSSKVWTFGPSGVSQGLATSYEERGSGGGALLHKDYTWTTDNVGRAYVGTVVNTQYAGAAQVQSKSTQTLDTYGNLTQSAVYDYGNLATAARTYNYTYLTDANYTNLYIRNRLTQATVTLGGTTTTVVDNWYDTARSGSPCYLGGLVQRSAWMHDDANYGTGMVYRGNLYWKSTLGVVQCFAYETTGVMTAWADGAGHTMSSAPSVGTNYSLPGVLTPGGNANLATTLTYAGSWAVSSLTGPNGASSTTAYDGWGRPLTTTIPDGATTVYTYTYAAAANQQTATLGTRWKRTTLDGFGRVTKVESGHDSTTVSQVDTQYAPCACSPLGKVWRVSMPYAPGGTPVWTTYTYDGSGRTLTVTAPDGSVTRTEYLVSYGGYTGSLVRVTDPAGKWKIQQTDALGQLIRVFEPNPAGGADWITNYTYDALGHLTDVSMPRSNGTQTRTFVYTGNNLTSATNPENGTVTYQYDASHHVTKRTDAIGQETRYTYDWYGRLTEVQHWPLAYNGPGVPNSPHEDTKQRVDYFYDTNPLNGSYSQNAWGRLTAVQFQDESAGTPWSYLYSYNAAGRVTAQRMNVNQRNYDAAYTWDNEGRMTERDYGVQALTQWELVQNWSPQRYTFQYDANGRLGGMQVPDGYGGMATVATASYGVAGEMTGLTYAGYLWFYETRTYNAMLQLTRMTTNAMYDGTVMDMQYVYAAGANNGRITQSNDGLSGETVNYTYDAVNRLSGVSAAGDAGGAWTQAYTYDGFGNLTGKTAAGTSPAMSASFDPLTNHRNGGIYDANGNSQGYSSFSYYDVENRPTSGGLYGAGEAYVYDPSGKRVKKSKWNNLGVLQEEDYYFYGIGGQKLATLECHAGDDGMACAPKYDVYFGGKLVSSKGLGVVTDRLGSVRATEAGERMKYYPYGEERTSTPDGREKFGTYFRDNPTQDYADQRYYAVGMGRFNSPDPYRAGTGPGEPSDPGTWNRYSYVEGDPVNEYDPAGLDGCSPNATCVTVTATVPGVLQIVSDFFSSFLAPSHLTPSQMARDQADVHPESCSRELASLDPNTELLQGSMPKAPAAAAYVIYRAVDALGKTQYVGMTMDFARRQAEHADRFSVEIIEGLENLSYIAARGVEQALIESYGLLAQEGGQLVNKINSVATKNSCYNTAVDMGRQLLDVIGFVK